MCNEYTSLTGLLELACNSAQHVSETSKSSVFTPLADKSRSPKLRHSQEFTI